MIPGKEEISVLGDPYYPRRSPFLSQLAERERAIIKEIRDACGI